MFRVILFFKFLFLNWKIHAFGIWKIYHRSNIVLKINCSDRNFHPAGKHMFKVINNVVELCLEPCQTSTMVVIWGIIQPTKTVIKCRKKSQS